ncbi:hypothetical protein [Rathayibacter sp. AY1C5]|uniref:hypothetical protein n=1 Tax=Rathayibacter sp. AY1C5 TaxID=2080538 RepID=UPI0011B0752B|nr:hypothetical protein [Rathayibacter sp. AY1C5]
MSFTVKEAQPRPGWFARRESHQHFANGLRVAVSVFGIVSFGIGVAAVFRAQTPEIGGTALVTLGAVAVLLAAIGRFPDRFSVGQWEVELKRDSLEEILSIVKAEAPDIFDQVAALARGGTRTPDAVDAAVKTAEASGEDEKSFENELIDQNSAGRLDLPDLRTEVDVSIPSKGRPPRVDAVFSLRGKSVAVEFKNNWTRSISNLTRQRLNRVLTSPDFIAAAVVVPRQFMRAAVLDIDDRRIVVVSPDQVHDLVRIIEAQLDSLR